MPETAPKLIHAAYIQKKPGGKCRLFLWMLEPQKYVWFEEQADHKEIDTGINASSTEEAIRLARQHWKNHFFRTVNCGFRYTLPERDEHGMNALLFQMVASYSTSNGVYFDDELGHNCFVQAASIEARELYQELKKTKGI